MNRRARRAYVLFVALSLVAAGTWASFGVTRDGSGRAPAPRPQFASAAALAAVGRLQSASSDPLRPPDLSGFRARLADGEFLVGAAEASIAPDPKRIQWDTAKTPCVKEDQTLVDPGASDLIGAALDGHVPPGWPRSPDCVYLGGFGIGPSRPAVGVDSYAGVQVRSIAISNGADTVLWQSFDMAGFFSRYRADLCPQGCGIYDIRLAIANATSDAIPMANIALNATHSHAGADGYGVFGSIPGWYRMQIREQALRSAFAALRDMRPATLTVGSIDARPFNNERRDTYYSSADYGAVWLQARELVPRGADASEGGIVATVVNFGAHPTVLGSDNRLMHGDWTGVAAKEVGDLLGGLGVVMQGALGNVSPSMPRRPTADLTGDRKTDDYDHVVQMARDFASFVGADIARGGHALVSNRIVAKTATIAHPVSNWLEVVGAAANMIDREFTFPTIGANGPSTYTWRKSPEAPPLGTCTTAGPASPKVDISAYRIGELTVVTAPGELFGTMSNVVKSKSRRNAWAEAAGGNVAPSGQTMVFGQTQDSLGYIIPSVEVDESGGVLTNTDPPLGSYEEELMIDRCFGDHVLQTQLELLAQLD